MDEVAACAEGGGGLRGRGGFEATHTGFGGRLGCRGELSSLASTFFVTSAFSSPSTAAGDCLLIVVCRSLFFKSVGDSNPP
jgi:hypothetical protein